MKSQIFQLNTASQYLTTQLNKNKNAKTSESVKNKIDGFQAKHKNLKVNYAMLK